MARTTTNLSDTQIRQTKPTNKVQTLSENGGLQLVIKPQGTKLWRLRYSHPVTKDRKLISLGEYPALTLANARKKRDEAHTLRAQGIDPHEYWQSEANRQLSEHEAILRVVAHAWFEVKKEEITAEYAKDVWESLELHVFPRLGNHPVNTITAPLLIDTLKPLAARGTLETVRRLCSRMNQIMNYATNTGIIQSNQISKVSEAFPKPEKKNLPSIEPEKLPSVLAQINNTQLSMAVRSCFFWSLHSLARPGEAALLRWNEVDWDKELVTIPPERMKRRRRHLIPLTQPMLNILKAMHRVSGHGQYVFESPMNPGKPINSQTVNAALKRMGMKGILCAHGLRSIASTALNENGFDSKLIEVSLAHLEKNESKAAYDRGDYIDRRREIMDWWSKYIQQAQIEAINRPGITNEDTLQV